MSDQDDDDSDQAPILEHAPSIDQSVVSTSYEYDPEFEMLVKAYMRDMNYTTVNQAALNIVCGTINAGVVALPYVTQQTGVPIFVATILAVSIISGYTSVLTVSMAQEQHVRSLEDLAEKAFGLRGYVIASVLQILFSLSLCCISLQVWADIMRDIMDSTLKVDYFLLTDRRGEVLLGSIIVLPLCLLKKSLANLRWTSYITSVAVVGALLAVIATYISDSDMDSNMNNKETARDVLQPKHDWWTVCYIASYIFSSNQKVLAIYSSLRRRSPLRWRTAVRRALTVCTGLYVIFGVFGFLSKERKDITIDKVNFFADDQHELQGVFDPARALVAISLLLTVPVDCLIVATTYRRLWSKLWKERGGDSSSNHQYAPLLGGQLSHSHHHSLSMHSAVDMNSRLWDFLCCCCPSLDQVRESKASSKGIEVEHIQSSLMEEEEHHTSPPPVMAPPVSSPSAIPRSPSLRRKIRRNRRPSATSTSQSLTSSSSHSTSQAQAQWSVLKSIGALLPGHVEGDSDEESPHRRRGQRKTLPPPINSMTAHHQHNQAESRASSTASSVRTLNVKGLNSDEASVILNNANNGPLSRTASLTPHAEETTNSGNGSGNNRGSGNNSGGGVMPSTDVEAGDANVDSEAEDEEYDGACPTREEALPVMLCWLLAVGVSLAVVHWLYLAASFGTLTSIALMFLLPAALYFKLHLASDFQALPLFRSVVPNQLYMGLVLCTGIVVFVFCVFLLFYIAFNEPHFIEDH